MDKTVLVTGASGVVGSAAVQAFCEKGWNVVAVSRRVPDLATARPFRHLALDLKDRAACATALRGLPPVTHVAFAALYEKPGLVAGWQEDDQMQTNLDLLRNTLEPLLEHGSLQHVSLMQGTKAYGFHLHPMPIPAREDAPRDPHANFYWLQEDWVRDAATRQKFAWTIFRPQMVMGGAVGAAMNLAPVLGAYAAITRELGEPFGFPGGPAFVWEAADARLVANALLWAATAPTASNQHFNLTNGDVFEWRNAWPVIAESLGVEPGPDAPRMLGSWLPAHTQVWDRIVARHVLKGLSLPQLLGESHFCADLCFASGQPQAPPPAFLSTIKLRQAGFTEVCDTRAMFKYWLRNLIDRRILPGA